MDPAMINDPAFSEFLTAQSAHLSLANTAIGLLLAAILSVILRKLYIKYGTSISNREQFSNTFILLATTTSLIIAIVKSSLALSLGLVGALSIVRFRSAIKEPEELVFLFICISIGLGTGANQFLVTIVAFFLLGIFIMFRAKAHTNERNKQLFLAVSLNKPTNNALEKLVKIVQKHCSEVDLKRYDLSDKGLEATFIVNLESFGKLNSVEKELIKTFPKINVSYLDRS